MDTPPDFDAPKNRSYNVHQFLRERSFMGRINMKADTFREFLAATCCACLSSVPSFLLVVLAVVLLMLLIATIPLAFAFTYMSPLSSSEQPRTTVNVIRQYTDTLGSEGAVKPRFIFKASDLLPLNITSCKGFGFACTYDPSVVIGTFQRCDGKMDCADGSDETNCLTCQTAFFCDESANRKRCLRGKEVCNGKQHCLDGSDEKKYCKSECAKDEQKCKGQNKCYPKSAMCDGDNFCPKGDDERNCTECVNGAKFCAPRSKCIPKWQLCDGEMNCPDNSDEKDCDCTSCAGSGKMLCNGEQKMCFLTKGVCDGITDCPAGEDEQNCPGACDMDDQDCAACKASLNKYKCASTNECYSEDVVCAPYSKCSEPTPQDKFHCALKMGKGRPYF